jgi:hypothetical protein
LHLSAVVQALPSSQALMLLAKMHPVEVSHESLVHGFWSLHVMTVPRHAPALQWSPLVQALASLQVFAFAFVNTHPTSALHESFVQGLPSSQGRAGPPVQTLAAQMSLVVHLSPSSHDFVFAVCAQPP